MSVGTSLNASGAIMRVHFKYRSGRCLTVASLIVASACLSGDRPTLVGPDLAVSDGAHSGGTPGFFFLPPMVSQPAFTGVFDGDIATVNPVVAICDVTDGPDLDCGASSPEATPAVRVYTAAGDPPITVDLDKYLVNWDTREGAFAAGRTYRVHVLGGTPSRELGFADILLTTEPGKVKKLTDGELVVLSDGRTLPIHFRIEQGVIVPAGPARALEVSGLGDPTVAGTVSAITVTARDEHGNVAAAYIGTIAFTSTDPAATLPGEYTFTAGDAGTHTFPASVTLRTAGSSTVTATDQAVGTITGAQTVTVTPAAPAELRFTTPPTGAPEGSVIAPPVVVTAFDPFGNHAPAFTEPVSIAIGTNPSGAVLTGTLQVTAVLGVATFADLGISADGVGYTLVAAAAGLASATSDPFDVSAVQPPEVHWINPAGGNWSVAANWNTGAVPAPDQSVFIDLDGTYTVTLDVNAGVNGLVLGGSTGVQTLALGTSRTLSISSSAGVEPTGRLSLSNATVDGPGTLSIAPGATLNLSGGSAVNAALVNAGTVATFNSSVLNGGLTTAAGSLLRVQSVGFGGATLTVASGFTNHGAIELTSTSANGVALTVNGTLLNAAGATIAVLPGAGGARTLTAQLDNQGTLSVGTALTINRVGADHSNSGLMTLAGGNLTVTQGGTSPSFSNTGTVTVNPGRVWSITGGSFTQAPGATLAGGGGMSLSSVGPAVFNTAFDLGALSLSSTTASFATDITTATLALSVNNSTVNGPGGLTNGAGKTLNLSGTTTVNTALANAGTLVILNGSVFNGGFTTVAGSVLRVQSVGFGGATLTVASGFTNHGEIELTGTTTNGAGLTVNGTLLNAAGATIASLVGAGGGRALTAQLDNQGTVTVAQPLTINRGSADHTNSGLISLTGNLTVSQSGTAPSFTNSGTVTVAPGATWAVSGGSFTHGAGATLDGGGAMSLSFVNPAAFNTAFSLSALSLSNTTASFATNVTTETLALSLNNSTVNGPGTLANAAGKTLNLSGTTTVNTALANAGTLVTFNSSVLNGALTTAASSLLRVQSVGFGGATLNVAGGGFTNHGIIELTGTTANGCALIVNGTLVNAAGATIAVLAGAGGARTLTAALDNQGTLSLGTALTINRASSAHANSGTITLNAGDFTITQSGTAPSFTNSGAVNLAGPGAIRVSAGTVANQAGGSIVGAGTFEAASSVPFDNAGSVTPALVRIGNALTGSGTFAPVTVEFFGSATTIPVGSGYAYNHVRVLSAAAFAGSATVPGNLTVAGTGNLTIGAHDIVVGGDFATQNTGVLTMQNAASSLTVGGNATFAGGSTNTRLTAGTLRVAGNLTQAGATAAFAASGSHVTVLSGSGAQTISFANPGAATTLSHFQRLEMENAGAAGVTLGGAVVANGQLRTPPGPSVARTLRSTGFTLRAGGLDATGLVLDGTPLYIVNGDALTTFDGAVFQNMDPAATQFRLDRLADAVTFTNVQFLTAPTTGVYLHLVDTDLLAPLFTVTMAGTQPANHGGKVNESTAGQLLGWPF